MPVLHPVSLTKFRDISWTEFIETSSFTEECSMSSEFGPLDKAPTTFLHNRTIRDFISNKNLDNKKKIILFSFYLNSVFTRIASSETSVFIHMAGLFLFLNELEEEFQKPRTKKPDFNQDDKLVRKFFFDLKRRVFNIFLYFKCYPLDLEQRLCELVETTSNSDSLAHISLYIPKKDIKESVSRMEFKKIRCLLEYFKHYTLIQEKSGNILNYSSAMAYIDQVPLCLFDIVKKNKHILAKKALELTNRY